MSDKEKLEPAVTFTHGGLKCDAPGCDFRDETILAEDYEKWVNAPCPKCGANLLTQEDFELSKVLRDIIGIVNETFPGRNPNEELVHMSIGFDGSGKPILGPIVISNE